MAPRAGLGIFPGIGPPVGARILGEIGDDRSRFATVGGLKACAGSAPTTRASGGRRRYGGRRFVKNNRRWAGGARYMQALRHLFNRMLGQLHHCLLARTPFDESIAFPAEPLPVATGAT